MEKLATVSIPLLLPALPAQYADLELPEVDLAITPLLQTPSLPALGCGSFHRMLPELLYSPVMILLLLVYLLVLKSLFQLNEVSGEGDTNN